MPHNTECTPYLNLQYFLVTGSPASTVHLDRTFFCHGPTPAGTTRSCICIYLLFSYTRVDRDQNKPRPVYHASLIERPDAPSDQHAVSAMSDDDQGPLMRGSVAAALFSATAFTAARVYCSIIVLNRTRREDIIIVLSLVRRPTCLSFHV